MALGYFPPYDLPPFWMMSSYDLPTLPFCRNKRFSKQVSPRDLPLFGRCHLMIYLNFPDFPVCVSCLGALFLGKPKSLATWVSSKKKEEKAMWDVRQDEEETTEQRRIWGIMFLFLVLSCLCSSVCVCYVVGGGALPPPQAPLLRFCVCVCVFLLSLLHTCFSSFLVPHITLNLPKPNQKQ